MEVALISEKIVLTGQQQQQQQQLSPQTKKKHDTYKDIVGNRVQKPHITCMFVRVVFSTHFLRFDFILLFLRFCSAVSLILWFFFGCRKFSLDFIEFSVHKNRSSFCLRVAHARSSHTNTTIPGKKYMVPPKNDVDADV